jgi:hypothetical protein
VGQSGLRAKRQWSSFEELTPRSFGISRLRGYVFVDFDELVSPVASLSFEFGLESFLSLGIPLCPDRICSSQAMIDS